MSAAVPVALTAERFRREYLKHLWGDSMTRKRRPVYFQCFNLPGGASYAATPIKKPYTKKGQKPSYDPNDPDLVASELETSLDEYEAYPTDTKQRAFPVLANRINTRRAIRELVLPEIAALAAALERIENRLEAIEVSVGDGKVS